MSEPGPKEVHARPHVMGTQTPNGRAPPLSTPMVVPLPKYIFVSVPAALPKVCAVAAFGVHISGDRDARVCGGNTEG